MQGPNTDTPAQFQGHPSIKTPFTPHMYDIQDHCANNVNIAFYPYDHIIEHSSVEINDIYIV